MFIRKNKLVSLYYKAIEETARACGRNLSERQKKELLNKINKEIIKNGRNEKKNS